MVKIKLELKIWAATLVAIPTLLFVPLRALAHMITIGGQACLFDDFGDGSVAFFSVTVGSVVAVSISCISCALIKSSSKLTRIIHTLLLALIVFGLSSGNINKIEIYKKALTHVRNFCTTSFPAPTAKDAFYTHRDQLSAIKPYTNVEFTAKDETIKISSGKGTLREIEFRKHKVSIEVDSIYSPKDVIYQVPACSKWPGREDWAGSDDSFQYAYDESVQDIASLPELMRLLKTGFDPALHMVFTHDGLCLGWYLIDSPKVLVIVVRQYLINGEKPTRFPNATEGKVKISERVVH